MGTNKAYKKITWMIVLFAAIVVFCGLAYRNTVHFEQTVVAQTQQHLLTIARIQAQRIEENINNVLEELERLAQLPRLKDLVNTDSLLKGWSSQEDDALEKYSFECTKDHIDALYRLDKKGIVQTRMPARKDGKRTGQDYSQKPGVKFVLENHRSYISKIFSTFSGQKAISVCVPVVQKDSLIGVLRALIYLDTLHDVVRPIKIGQKGYAWIIDDSGIMIAHPKPEHIGKDIIAVRKEAFPGFDWSRLEHIVARMTNSEQGVGSYSSAWWQDQDLELVEKLTAFAPIRIGNALWSVGVSMGYDEISGPIKSHDRNILALAGILTLMFVAIAVGFYRIHEEKAMLQMQASSARQLESINKQLQSEVAEREGAEQALAQQVHDLERFNRSAVGRELRMIELKRQINDLAQQADKQAPYDLSLDQKVAQRTDQLKAAQTAALNIMEDTEQARKEAELTNVALSKEISERKQAEEALRRIEWLLTKKFESDQNVYHSQSYGNLVDLNTCRVVANVDEEGVLRHIVNGYLDLLDTSAAVYEKNGDYALGIFTSGWCRMLDQASRNLCDTDDNREALASGKWHCHESCWIQAAKPAIETGQPVDIECCGGIRLYAVPIWAGGQVVGAINCGYGDPPRDPQQLQEIAEKYAIGLAELTKQANAYQSRPPFVIDIVKKRLATSAKVIGTMIESRQAEDKLRDSEEKYRQLVNTLVDAVISIDCRMNVLVWNQGAERIFGYTQDEMLGQSVERIVPEEYKEAHDKAFVQFSKSGSGPIIGKTREVQGVRKDGTKVPIELSISSRKDGRQYIATATIRDITDRKHTEELMMLQSQELRRSNRELEQFAYIASHDLQEPLRMVTSYTQLLARRYGDKLDKDANEFINYAVDGATRMRNLINALLEYSRVGTRGRQLEPVDCNAVFDNACENLQAAIEESNAKVTCDTLPTVMADEIQLMQLFQNLIGNAIKYKGTEAPKVHVWAKRINGQWSFSVSDNGIGIDPQHADRIFIAFQRLHNKKEYSGTGIGLAICRKIVERHGGKISVQSQEGQGSTFCFTLSALSEEAVPAEVDKQPCTTQ